MVWYVALVAILNLGLGYALAVYLSAREKNPTTMPDETDASLESPSRADDSAERSPELSDDVPFSEETPTDIKSAATVDPIAANLTDPITGLTTREHIAQCLTDMTLAHVDHQPMTVALVEVDQAAQDADGVDDRLLRGIAGTVRDMLAEVHTAGRYSDQQFLLLLPHDDLQHATQRAEQVRQRVAATHYIADGQQIPATVTCALAQVAASHTADSLLESLQEALEEAKRYGGNRTFMHDGTTHTPVVPPELNFAPQTCEI